MPFKGVFWHDHAQKWKAQVKHSKKAYYAGLHESEKEAAKALDRFLYKLNQEFDVELVEGGLQVGLTPHEKAVLDHMSLGDLQLEVRRKAVSRVRAKAASQFIGVSTHGPGKWKARISACGKSKYLGTFSTEKQAAEAHDRAALARHGRTALLNFPVQTYSEANTQSPASALAPQPPTVGKKLSPSAMGESQTSSIRECDGSGSAYASEVEELFSVEGDNDWPVWPLTSQTEVLPWNQPLPSLEIPDGGLEYPTDEEELQLEFNAAMKYPRFRLYMERRITKGSTEPNLHILGQPPFDPWPFVSPEEALPPPQPLKPNPFDKYRASAHLCPENVCPLSDDEGEARVGCDPETLAMTQENLADLDDPANWHSKELYQMYMLLTKSSARCAEKEPPPCASEAYVPATAHSPPSLDTTLQKRQKLSQPASEGQGSREEAAVEGWKEAIAMYISKIKESLQDMKNVRSSEGAVTELPGLSSQADAP